jgi:hypothetical protein
MSSQATPLQAALDARTQATRQFLKAIETAQSTLKSRAADLARGAKLKRAPPGLKLRAARYQALANALSDTRVAFARVPKKAADSFIVTGRVTSSADKPMANVKVSLSDAKGIVNARVQPVTTDAAGYYSFTLRTAEFPEFAADAPQMFISVTDAANRELAKPAQPIQYGAGKLVLLPIIAR